MSVRPRTASKLAKAICPLPGALGAVVAVGTGADLALAVKSNLAVMRTLDAVIERLEKTVKARVKLRPAFKPLLTVNGIGDILGLTIMLETGEIQRFAKVGCFASYCRCVDSQKLSNGKKKGKGNVKNGNRYLAWAFIEAAYHGVRCSACLRRFHQRKKARANGVLASKAVAHKLARASYYVMRDQVPFDMSRAFC